MRSSVLGIPFFWNEQKVAENSLRAAKVTHADPRSVTSAVIISVIVSRLLSGEVEVGEMQTRKEEQLIRNISKGTAFDAGSGGSETEIPSESRMEPKEVPSATGGFLAKISNYFKKTRKGGQPTFEFPEYKPVDRARGETPAKLPEILPEGMDTFGTDPEMNRICGQVVRDYSFLLTSSPFYQSESTPTWLDELWSHSFPNTISELKLDDSKSMGYTFKCLGAAIYCATRAKKNTSDAEFFRMIITELTLEAGDADTNCAVAGALLGCRLGKSGLPSDWLEGLRHANFLETICEELCSLVSND